MSCAGFICRYRHSCVCRRDMVSGSMDCDICECNEDCEYCADADCPGPVEHDDHDENEEK